MSESDHARTADKSAEAFRTISEVSLLLDIPQHVLRFWETKFTRLKPMKRAGGRRYYRPEDVALIAHIRDLLYGQGYTIRGVQKLLREGGMPAPNPAAPPVSPPSPPRPPATAQTSRQAPPPASSTAQPAPDGGSHAPRLAHIRDELRSMYRLLAENTS